MFSIEKSQNSRSKIGMLKGSKGVSLCVWMEVETPFAPMDMQAAKNLTHEEAMLVRDYLNKHYPINYVDVIDCTMAEIDIKVVPHA